MSDATAKNHFATFNFLEKLAKLNLPVVFIINKIDIAKKEDILKLAKEVSKYDFVKKVFMISALKNDGINDLTNFLETMAPKGPWLYQIEQKTDSNLLFRLSEITREKIFNKLNKEVPYSIYVETEQFRETEKKAKIYQSIVVMKDSQKGIVLGKNGAMIKSIKEDAIFEIKNLLHKKIELKLFVKVKEDWVRKKEHLQNAGIIY
jgi:GTP-binding protein Era